MGKTTTQVNFTTIKGNTSKRPKPSERLEAKVESWINTKIAQGWSLRDIFVVSEHTAHVVMVRKGAA